MNRLHAGDHPPGIRPSCHGTCLPDIPARATPLWAAPDRGCRAALRRIHQELHGIQPPPWPGPQAAVFDRFLADLAREGERYGPDDATAVLQATLDAVDLLVPEATLAAIRDGIARSGGRRLMEAVATAIRCVLPHLRHADNACRSRLHALAALLDEACHDREHCS